MVLPFKVDEEVCLNAGCPAASANLVIVL
jgi:hypothetical protein